jgi:protein TonB
MVESPAPVPEKDRPAVSNDAAAQTPGPDPMPDEQAMAVDRGSSNAPERSAATAGSPQVTASVPLYALNPAPAYPTVARRRNYQGTVFLNVRVDRQGRAVEVEVQQSSGYAVLDQSAVKSVRQWRFEPARRAGQPIDMWVRVPVRFALE